MNVFLICVKVRANGVRTSMKKVRFFFTSPPRTTGPLNMRVAGSDRHAPHGHYLTPGAKFMAERSAERSSTETVEKDTQHHKQEGRNLQHRCCEDLRSRTIDIYTAGFWVMTSCCLANGFQCLEEAYRFVT